MGKDIISWMRKNSRVFRHAGSFLSYTKKRDSMLLVGPFAASLAPFYRSIGFNGLLYSFDDLAGGLVYQLMVVSLQSDSHYLTCHKKSRLLFALFL